MAGIGQPAMLGALTKDIKTKHPDIIIQYHGHSGPGLSMASILEVCNNGADVIDTAIEPLSWGKVHPDIISVQSMLKNEGFEVKDINMNAYMKARSLTQEFIDEWLGYFINPGNKHMSSLLLGCGLPGGMMGSMMADLAGIHHVINNTLKAKGEPELSTDDMLVKLFNEVEYVWPRVGYPPLVTPFSQYVKNIALMNLLTMAQGKGRFVMMDDSMWGMILGKSGRVPGEIAPELKELAAKQGREFTDADPRTLIPNALDDFRKEMDENGWDYGKDDEELYELAMHPEQYRNYKSGQAKKTSSPTCKKLRMPSSAHLCRQRNSQSSSTLRLTQSLLRSRDKYTGNSTATANRCLPLSLSSARNTTKATHSATSRHHGARLCLYRRLSAASSLR